MVNSCKNPFAPKVDLNLGENSTKIGDISSINGLFTNFQYAYTFQDTTIFGKLLAKDFVFSFRDYELGADISWGRDEEMKVTNGLFNNSDRLDLIWNSIVTLTDDSTNIIRNFNLTVTFNPTDVIFVSGKVNLFLRKNEENEWKIVTWRDESNY